MPVLNRGPQIFEHRDLILPTLVPFYALWTPMALVTTALYYHRRNLFPIYARRAWMVAVSQLCFILWLSLWGMYAIVGVLIDNALPCEFHRVVIFITSHVLIYTGVFLIAMRVFCLYFTFELSAIKSRTMNDVEFATSPEVKWFVDHRHWISKPFLARVFWVMFSLHCLSALLFITVDEESQCGKLGTDVFGNERGRAYQMETAAGIGTLVITTYVLAAVSFAFRYRKFENDVFQIRQEIGWAGWAMLVSAVTWTVVAYPNPVQEWADRTYPLALVPMAVGVSIMHGLHILRPLYQSYHSPQNSRSFSRRAASGSGSGTSEFDMATIASRPAAASSVSSPMHSLPDMLKSPNVRAAFQKHLESEFSVENLACFTAIEDLYKLAKTASRSEVIAAATHVVDEYLTAGALMEVNVSWDARHSVRKTLDSVCQQHLEDPDLEAGASPARVNKRIVDAVFHKVVTQICILMARDSFPRFEASTRLTAQWAGSLADARGDPSRAAGNPVSV